MPPALFAVVILGIESCFLPRLTWTSILLFYASHPIWDDRHVPPHPGFSPLTSWKLFCPGLAWNHDPPNCSLPQSNNLCVCVCSQALDQIFAKTLPLFLRTRAKITSAGTGSVFRSS
jgi:hypothetical protein